MPQAYNADLRGALRLVSGWILHVSSDVSHRTAPASLTQTLAGLSSRLDLLSSHCLLIIFGSPNFGSSLSFHPFFLCHPLSVVIASVYFLVLIRTTAAPSNGTFIDFFVLILCTIPVRKATQLRKPNRLFDECRI
ncbi:hypothetical protein BDV36DRAFT_57207 [Aspergillus pseudocaelatus]|uniref:Uncharacterized protein n=1 Tax=Aspergillus pseudocaelatus TaxID=1825620 RepID=A0ABQ6W5Z8_9EURO|nr:hypothetical protein BDV36DRAFT_57207 [Aspergillus pseudocaelatus]